MTSKIVVNNIEADSGINTVSFNDQIKVGSETTIHSTGIDLGSGNINSHNLNSTGIVTAIGLDVSGNVSIAGTLTYEDVTNIDAVGIITAQSGIHVTSGSVGIGTNNPSELLHLQSGHTKQILKSTNLNTASSLIFDTQNINTADFLLGQLAGRWNGNDVAYINFEAGSDTTNDDDGVITFLTSASGSSPTERLRITSGGDIGIGQASPSKKLHVVDSRSSTYEIVSKFAGGTGESSIAAISLVSAYSDTANDHEGHVTLGSLREGNGNRAAFIILTADDASTSTEKIRITSDGNMGIGHQKPSAGLHIKKQGRNFGLGYFYDGYSSDNGLGGNASSSVGSQTGERTHSLILESTSTAGEDIGASIGFRARSSAGSTLGDVTFGAIIGAKENSTTDGSNNYTTQSKGYLAFYTSDSYHFNPHYGTLNTERMRITSAGRMGINNTNPSTMLEVGDPTKTSTGSITISNGEIIGGGTGPSLSFRHGPSSGTQRTHQIYSYVGDLRIVADSNENMEFHTGGSESARIESGGDVVSFKTLIATDSGTTARDSFYNGNRGVGLFARNAYSNCGEHIEIGTDADRGWANLYLNRFSWSSGDDERMINFGVNNTSRGTITATTSGVTYNTGSDIRLKTDIRPISDATSKLMAMNPVTHKWKEHPDSDTVHGFIAQEMQNIVPEAVHGEPEGEQMMGMDYGRITPIIVAALQNAIEEINTLKQRISELEN